MALDAKLALLLIHILSVAGNGYSSLQENYYGSEDEHRKKLDSSFKSGFATGYAFSAVSILAIFMSCCVPWASLNKRKRNKIMMNTPMITSFDGKAREEDKRSQRAGIPIRLSFHHFFFNLFDEEEDRVAFIKDISIFFSCQDHEEDGSLQTELNRPQTKTLIHYRNNQKRRDLEFMSLK
jgi:interleukin-1 receptor-associated kinase 1